MSSLFTSEMTRRHWAVALLAGVVSFGSVSWFVRGDPSTLPGVPVSPAPHGSAVAIPYTPPFAPKQVAETNELPDITLDSLKASGVSEGEIAKAIEKLLDDKPKAESVLAGDKLAPTDASTAPLSVP